MGRATKLGTWRHRARMGLGSAVGQGGGSGAGRAAVPCLPLPAPLPAPHAHPARQLRQQEAPSCARPKNPRFFLFFFSSPVAGVRRQAAPGSPGWLHVSRIHH